MLSKSRKLVLLLAAVAMMSATSKASVTATITVNGAEQSGDTNSITVAFNGFTETAQYGQFSTPASIASALAGMFSRDYLQAGLCAAVASPGGSVINFKLKGGAAFGTLDVTGSTTSFTLQGSGFQSQESVKADSGVVTLTVSNSGGTLLSKSTSYTEGSTTSSIAEGLAGSSSNVNVTAINDTLYIQAAGAGANTDYIYTVTSLWNQSGTSFTSPSFSGSPASGALTGGAGTGGQPQPVYNYSITSSSGGSGYDPVGNVTNFSDSVTGTWSFAYDTLNRLATAASNQPGNPYPNYCWSYDSFGNRTTEMSASVAFPGGQGGANTCSTTGSLGQNDWAQYNGSINGTGNNQMSATSQNPNQGAGYDAAGDVTNDGVTQYLYDGEGRVCAVASTPVPGFTSLTGYVYDADGNRVAKGTLTQFTCDLNPADSTYNGLTTAGNETDYILGVGGEEVTEVAQDANGSLNWQRTYSYADALLATYDISADSPSQPLPSFRLTDWLGTLRATTDSYGVAQGTCNGLPFGDPKNPCQGNIPDNLYFTGKERDAESGNDYFGARYYASSMGRFMSPDWSVQVEPVPYAKLDDPQSLNLYAYVRNNPLSRIDANGHYENNDSGCNGNAKCQKKYDKAANKFETRRQKDLNSKKADVRAAAAAYGARGEANGVHVGFADLASHGLDGSVSISQSTPGNTNIQVTLDFGRAGSAETQTHEGTHVGDDLNFLNSWNSTYHSYDMFQNVTHGQTEFNAFKAGAEIDQEHGFGPNDTGAIWHFLQTDPHYGPILNVPVFDPNTFPQGLPYEPLQTLPQ